MKAISKRGESMKEKDLNFIKGITSIKIIDLCKEEKVKTSNLYTMKVSKEKLHNIKENIDNKIKAAYKEYNETDSTL